jgi:hypothetical protein
VPKASAGPQVLNVKLSMLFEAKAERSSVDEACRAKTTIQAKNAPLCASRLDLGLGPA